ncbi:MAG: hypothetical protein JRH11_03715 [Deltaproteobacteria bacterium]|nr:hypothetical protein [Deltaproteobacteria bacterium]
MRRRIWSEAVPPREAAAPEVLTLLARADVQLIQAVFPHTLGDAGELVRACRSHGVSVGLWPMLDDIDGRWASRKNGVAYAEHVRRLLEVLGGTLPDTVAIDLEPPISDVRRMLAADPRPLLGPLFAPPPLAGERALEALVDDLNRHGIETLAALVPPLGTGWIGTRGYALAFGSPLPDLRLQRLGPMGYTTLLSGYSRGTLRRADARALLAMVAKGAARHLGPAATLSLGVVGGGALGDEATYRTPADLAEDVAVARAAGVDDLALFSLDGLLGRPPAARWLEAFTETPAAAILERPSRRARALRLGISASGAALSALAATARFGRRRGLR